MAEMTETAPAGTGWQRRLTTYDKWVKEQGLPVTGGISAHLNQLELVPWERTGGKGALVRLAGAEQGYTDGQVCEIPPGGQLKPQRHLYEETVYILSGRGTTAIWYSDGQKQTFEWKQHSLFALPPNAWYQHYNLSGDEPARYYAVTDAPLIMDLFHNDDFVFNNDFRFTDRFDDAEGHFSGRGSFIGAGRTWETNYLADIGAFELHDAPARGGGTSVQFELGNSTLVAHVSEFPVGTYKKAHRHGSGANIVILSGTGYTLHWWEPGKHEPGHYERIDWQQGTTFVPQDMAFHQHFNTGQTPARYLAIRWGGGKYRFWPGFNREDGGLVTTDIKLGGNQIEYPDEDPWIYQTYLEACAKYGVKLDMDRLFVRDGRPVGTTA